MFRKVLIANRGEIACRVIKTAKRLGIQTVAVYSSADTNALHVSQADEAIYIGEAQSSESYLRADKIISAALKTGAQAIHPGYGFLSENSAFAKSCAEKNLVFIGPKPAAIQAMGSKSASKQIMQKAGIPLVPGYHGDDQNPELLKRSADEMGYPVLLKAVAGGGGKGMRQVWSSEEFDQGLKDAKREAMASFGNDDMLVEKYLTQPRHVEVQVFCDQSGNGVYLFERDCSIQRRHQKVIEEAPAPNVSEELRAELGQTAIKAAQAIDYVGAGTVEFLLNSDGKFYFMEMNTRLQVEHPVTEMITGQDLVEWQFNVAAGEELPLQQAELSIHGHAFEARVYAEDPRNNFLPTTGTLTTLLTPEETDSVRIDTGVQQGDAVSPYYDPMIAKLVVWGETRAQALQKLACSLRQYRVNGLQTNIDFLHDLAVHPAFVNADLDTGFIETHADSIFKEPDIDQDKLAITAATYLVLKLRRRNTGVCDPWSACDAWRMNHTPERVFDFVMGNTDVSARVIFNLAGSTVQLQQTSQAFSIAVSDSTYEISGSLTGDSLTITIDGHREVATVAEKDSELCIFNSAGRFLIERINADLGEDQVSASVGEFIAPMNGSVVEILVKAGDKVADGQPVLIMEAMKMQHTMSAPNSGIVEELFCEQGDLVDGGTQLLKFSADIREPDHA